MRYRETVQSGVFRPDIDGWSRHKIPKACPTIRHDPHLILTCPDGRLQEIRGWGKRDMARVLEKDSKKDALPKAK